MATNVYLSDAPNYLWNTAYSDINFVFDFKSYQIFSITEQISSSVGTGKAQINLYYTWDINPVKNEYVFIDIGSYTGIHRVLSSTNSAVVIDFEYTGDITDITYIKHLRLPQFTLYKGFQSSEAFSDTLPYTLVTNFTYSFNQNIQIQINIKGLAQKCFTIQEPIITQDYDFSVFNAFRLSWDEEITDYCLILNSSIPTEKLNAVYLSNGLPLTNVEEQLLWGCGNTFFTIFDGGYPKLKVFNGYDQAVTGFNNAFQTNQFAQGFDIT
ncbi:MAG: hypothetical protein RIR01_566 [Bacteroidota bacterium]